MTALFELYAPTAVLPADRWDRVFAGRRGVLKPIVEESHDR